jgi:creatinine amidohydrolase
LWFEDNAVGRLKKEVWEASEEQLKAMLAEYGFPAAGCEWAKPGAYIQTTPHHQVVENRHKNDIVFIPVG